MWFKRKAKQTKETKPVSVAPADAGRLMTGEEYVRPVFLSSLLVLAITGSALSVIYAAFEYRHLFNRQQVLVAQWDEFQVEWGQLLLEESALGANNRVERIASKTLEMTSPESNMIEIVKYER